MERESLLVIGANSFVAQHVLHQFHAQPDHVRAITTLDFDESFQRTLEYTPSKDITVTIKSCSFDNFAAALADILTGDITTVINCVDYQDLTILPDSAAIYRLNEELVDVLTTALGKAASVRRVIHMSSLLVGASFMAPSVFSTEISMDLPYPSFSVFPDYIRAKQNAETRINTLECQVFILRLPMVYGEGDTKSFIMDVLRYANAHGGSCPLIRRPHGKIQYAYAGNVGYGTVCALNRMRKEPEGKKEVIHLVDNTPTGHTWDLVKPYTETRGFVAPPYEIPFYAFYVPWRLVELGVFTASKLGLPIPWRLRSFPGSGVFYTHFFYWYFWSGVKARLYLDFVPKYDPDESVKRASLYYKGVDLDLPKKI